MHHLDNDRAPQIGLPGEVDLTHAAFAKQALDFVST
jgi:hypothetical protein